jgi:CubicO group peptidase (beta-lactamase class C family)
MPLGFQPGSTWDYSYSTDVLGRVVEVAAGKPLGEILRERILDPLGMTDTDYARFAQALLNGGELDGNRIIGPATLGYMTSDHPGPSIAKGNLYLPGAGYGFGLGFAVRTTAGEAAFPSSVGEYYWGGAGGAYSGPIRSSRCWSCS